MSHSSTQTTNIPYGKKAEGDTQTYHQLIYAPPHEHCVYFQQTIIGASKIGHVPKWDVSFHQERFCTWSGIFGKVYKTSPNKAVKFLAIKNGLSRFAWASILWSGFGFVWNIVIRCYLIMFKLKITYLQSSHVFIKASNNTQTPLKLWNWNICHFRLRSHSHSDKRPRGKVLSHPERKFFQTKFNHVPLIIGKFRGKSVCVGFHLHPRTVCARSSGQYWIDWRNNSPPNRIYIVCACAM